MSRTIEQALNTHNIVITPTIIDRFDTMVMSWEIRRLHAIALNSQGIGLTAIAFTDNDRSEFFAMFALVEKDVRHLIQTISAINSEYRVISDPFNIVSIWLLHVGFRDITDPHQQHRFLMAVAKFLHYRFFTSLVNHYFPHGAVERYMNAAINGLSRKFDIVIYGTWKATIEARCEDLISADGIHHKALVKADDDKAFLYALVDTNNRIRDKIKNVTAAYYEARENGDTIGSRSATTEVEGEKILVHTAKTLDLIIYNLQNEIATERLFIDNATVHSIATQFNNVSEDMLRSALRSMVELAVTQANSKQLDLIKMNDGHETYIGMRVFLTNLIQKSYRYCMRNGVDITNRAAVFIKSKNVYSSSRINDEDILAVKQSVTYLVEQISTSRRETTKGSLRLGLILYILVRSFRFL
jgi:hypothetical protein